MDGNDNNDRVSTVKSQPLKELVNWLEQVHFQGGPCGAAFEQNVSPVLVTKSMAMLEWALSTGRQVELFTTTVSARALLSSLVLRRSRVSLQNILDLDDAAFDRLTKCLAEILGSGLELVEGPPPEALRGAAFLGGPLFAVMMP